MIDDRTYGEKILDKLIEDNGEAFNISFFPYKYSMWDSMETLFDACVKRPHIYTACYPISYMTRGDGMWHNETSSFKEAVMLYDNPKQLLMETDIAVIHNPYDGNNKVTSVDPEFYSDKIKASGRKIVYLAYMGYAYADHLIVQPGVLNADYIFTASEGERQRYIDVLMNNRGVDKSDNVFCVGGLPKHEAIKKPRQIISTGGVNNKFVVLICGGLMPFLQDPEGRINKWRDAIERYADDDRCYVIFRPHPLTSDAINAMRRDARKIYDDFIEEMQSYIHVDLEPDLETYLHYADFLISDPSSVVDIWRATGRDFEVMR